MSAGAYLAGILWLGVIVAALGFGAVRTRRRLLPDFVGSAARLAEVTLALGAFVLVPELLGAVGWFRPVPVLVALTATGIGAGLLADRRAPAEVGGAPEEPTASVPAAAETTPFGPPWWRHAVTVAGVTIAAIVFAQWTGHVVSTYTSASAGIWDGDSLWYHLPFATNFVQSGWVTRPLFTNADTLVTYFPANSEVVLGLLLMPLRRDVAVPLVSLGWLALAFLAAWSLGRRYGAPAVALAGAAVALSVPVMAATQGGTARNDAMGVALFLAACALLVHAQWSRNGVFVAGVAAGLALGVKLSVLIPVVLLSLAVVIAAPRGRRVRVAVPWALSLLIFGSFWYVRNLARVGNPVPTVALHVGPLRLPSVFAESVAGSAVADRLREAGAVNRVLRPGLRDGFGDLWWVLGLLVVVIAVSVLARGPDRVARALGAVVLAGLAGYVMMPNGSPNADSILGPANFMLNLRYAAPALVLGLTLVGAVRLMHDVRWASAALAVFAVVIAVTVSDPTLAEQPEWATSVGQRLLGFGVVAVAVIVAVAVWVLVRQAPRSRRVVVVVAGLVLVVLAGNVLQHTYLDRRYRSARKEFPLSVLWPWARDLPATRLGIVGTILQYPFVGERVATTVRYVGVPRSDGGFRSVRTCEEWRERLRDGRYRYVVTTTDMFLPNGQEIANLNQWTRTVAGVRVVRAEGPVTLYELSSPPDPRACP